MNYYTYNQIDAFSSTLQKSQQWITELQDTMECESPQEAYHALRAVLQTLRDHLPLDEVAQFSAQLPMLLRGLYYEGWHPNGKPLHSRNPDHFFERLAAHFNGNGTTDLIGVTQSVFTLLKNHISPGEIRDIIMTMPNALKEMWL